MNSLLGRGNTSSVDINSGGSRAFVVIATCAALHPVFRWIALRAIDGSDEPWGIAALAAAAIAVIMRRSGASDGDHVAGPTGAERPSLVGPSLWLTAYVAGYPWLTPLPRGILAMIALALLLSRLYLGARLNLGLLGLLLLGLPLIASAQFYLGYPLRLLVAQCTAGLLRLSGFGVDVAGVGLELGERMIMVDAPCSGIKMLWVGAFAASLLAVLGRMSARATLVFMLGAAVSLFLANVLRAAALFFVELELMALPAWTHEGVGLLMFAVALAAIGTLGHGVGRWLGGGRDRA